MNLQRNHFLINYTLKSLFFLEGRTNFKKISSKITTTTIITLSYYAGTMNEQNSENVPENNVLD